MIATRIGLSIQYQCRRPSFGSASKYLPMFSTRSDSPRIEIKTVLDALKVQSYPRAIEIYESIIKTKFEGHQGDDKIHYGAAVAYSKLGETRSVRL